MATECCGLAQSGNFCMNCGTRLRKDPCYELLGYLRGRLPVAERNVAEKTKPGSIERQKGEQRIAKWKRWIKWVQDTMREQGLPLDDDGVSADNPMED